MFFFSTITIVPLGVALCFLVLADFIRNRFGGYWSLPFSLIGIAGLLHVLSLLSSEINW
jgi:hypothetical protein